MLRSSRPLLQKPSLRGSAAQLMVWHRSAMKPRNNNTIVGATLSLAHSSRNSSGKASARVLGVVLCLAMGLVLPGSYMQNRPLALAKYVRAAIKKVATWLCGSSHKNTNRNRLGASQPASQPPPPHGSGVEGAPGGGRATPGAACARKRQAHRVGGENHT
jgi:hypothetical protein